MENTSKSKLRILTSNGSVYNYDIKKDKTFIGRDKRNDIIFAQTNISRFHARIEDSPKGVLLNDLDSFNGTLVNEKRIKSVLLQPYDQIRVGFNTITYLPSSESETTEESAVEIIPEKYSETDDQLIVKTSPRSTTDDGTHKTPSLNIYETQVISPFAMIKDEAPDQSTGDEDEPLEPSVSTEEISVLVRNNKVLYILYEITRHMNIIQNFNDLLNKIMDLIFTVIDADSGFFMLVSDDDKKKLVPVVVKYRDDEAPEKEKLRVSRTIINKVLNEGVALLTSNAMDDAHLGKAESVFIQQIRSAMCVPILKQNIIIGAIQLYTMRLDNHFTEQDLELLKAIGNQIALIIEQAHLNKQIQEEEKLRGRLERFHSPQIIEFILNSIQSGKDDFLDPKYIDATILFCDIIGFTSLSERTQPMQTIMLLNRFFSRMTDIIFKHGGTLDKFIGDGLMAVFGAPLEGEDDAQKAVLTALEMRNQLVKLMSKTPKNNRFKIRMGINSGRVVAGNIGSAERMDYSVIGDAVNTASRLESIAGPNQILIGENTYLQTKDKFKFDKIGPIRVKGKSTDIVVYEVLD
ncbi:adenylate/guanylate cyclase domain-containing protein [Thermodesulfobacteriota bacterium]